MENKGEIYLITCNINNKRYIGQAICFIKTKNYLRLHGTEGRWKKHIAEALSKDNNRCKALNSAIRKYGVHNFSIKTILICDIKQLNYYEFKYIRQYNTQCPYGYNIRCGGGSKGKQSEETIEKIRIAKSGINNHMYGKHHTNTSKAKISSSNTGKVRTVDHRKAMSAIKGRKPEFQNLPMYIYYVKKDKFEGYVIKHHPKLTLTKKSFTSTKYSLDQKLQMAIKYIEEELK